MLMRTDPFRDFDRFAQQALGTPTRPAAMPIDAYRKGDEFIVHFDLTEKQRADILAFLATGSRYDMGGPA